MNQLFIIFLFIFSFISLSASKTSEGNLNIEIVGIRNDIGFIKLIMHNSKDGFPADAKKASKISSLDIKNGKASVKFDNIPYGTYAVMILHDENNNNKMDFTFYGKPKEGYGASKDATGFLGPPSFEDASFAVDKNITTVTLKLKY